MWKLFLYIFTNSLDTFLFKRIDKKDNILLQFHTGTADQEAKPCNEKKGFWNSYPAKGLIVTQYELDINAW